MITTIANMLGRKNVKLWRIKAVVEETAELFFVRRELDTRRIKDTRKYEVTLFRDMPEGRASTSVVLTPSMTEGQIARALDRAYAAAQYAANPPYRLPDPVEEAHVSKDSPLARRPLAESAGIMAKALFAPDVQPDAFVNSAEIFVKRVSCRIHASTGTDVSYTDAQVSGEFVVQCREPEDVEMFNMFSFDTLDEQGLSDKVAEALRFVRDRARAQRVLRSGQYDLILSGNSVGSLLSYYVSRSSAASVYAQYSTWKRGEDVQGETTGERLDLTLQSSVPYSDEGIPMRDMHLIQDGKLLGYHGPAQFCRYLRVPPTGEYQRLVCANGTVPLETLKGGTCLWVVTFSAFQTNAMSGHFGGEIRLAYLIEDGRVTPVTGGSVSGNILEAQKDLRFSTERYTSARYDGPYAVRLKNASVAGTAD